MGDSSQTTAKTLGGTTGSTSYHQSVRYNNASSGGSLTLTGPITVSNVSLYSSTSYALFADGGYQITATGQLSTQSSSILKLGSATSATTFPGFTSFYVGGYPYAFVEYAAGVAQTVTPLPSATCTNCYYRGLTISGGGVKTLGNLRLYYDVNKGLQPSPYNLTIQSGSTLDQGTYNLTVDCSYGSSYAIGVNGTLSNFSTGSLTLNGNSGQTNYKGVYVSSTGIINFNGGGAKDGTNGCGGTNKITIQATDYSTGITWTAVSGAKIRMVDVNVSNQNATGVPVNVSGDGTDSGIFAYGSTDGGGNTKWNFKACGAPGMPTAIKLASFTATDYNGSVLLQWKTGYEVDNLGFLIYREEKGQQIQVTPSVIAGSALVAGAGTALKAGRSYAWWDDSSLGSAQYWLEDIDLNGQRTRYGPIKPVASNEPPPRRLRLRC